MTLSDRRRYFAEDIQTLADLRTTALVEALAAVPRERFLPPGPWTIRSEWDIQKPLRETLDADPRRVYHNVAVAIDRERMLFNGAPSLVASTIDALDLEPGDRVLHVGTGTGYYTALLAETVGPTGHVLGLEVDPGLADRARTALDGVANVEVRAGDGTEAFGVEFDAILVNAGVTHPLPQWLDALAPRGRLMVPITATSPAMGPIGKGLFVHVTLGAGSDLTARVVTFVAIYSAVGIRDEEANRAIGQALSRNPFPKLSRLRRDAHESDAGCWVHAAGCCLS